MWRTPIGARGGGRARGNRPLRLRGRSRADAHDPRADADRAPEFFEKLVVEGGLRQVAVHIDMTQAGRHGFPIGRVKTEADLHPVREAFTELGWRSAGKPACHWSMPTTAPSRAKTSTECRRSSAGFWPTRTRTQLWRMLSFQPEADTGRTIFSQEPITPALTVGKDLRRDRSAAAPRCEHLRPSRLQ